MVGRLSLYLQRTGGRFRVELLGGTTDLHAGSNGGPGRRAHGFTVSGRANLEQLASKGEPTLRLPVHDPRVGSEFSGPRLQLLCACWTGSPLPVEDLALAVLDCLVESIFLLVAGQIGRLNARHRE